MVVKLIVYKVAHIFMSCKSWFFFEFILYLFCNFHALRTAFSNILCDLFKATLLDVFCASFYFVLVADQLP